MLYYFAPLEGLTDAIYREAHRRYFGGPDRYFAPFLSPKKDLHVDPRQLRDVLPDRNPRALPVPQILTKDPAAFCWMAGELAAMGYREVNLNLGCPAGTVTAKGKGAGFLRDPAGLSAFLDEVCEKSPLPLSVKTRVGMTDPAEFPALLAVYNAHPLQELIVHPRVGRALYRGPVDKAAFAQAEAESRAPLCYNGNLHTAAAVRTFAAAHPGLHAIMLGRGLIADPALVRQLKGGPALEKPELRAFLDELYDRYTRQFGSPQSAIRRMKGHWNYLLRHFAPDPRLERQLRKAADPVAYRVAVDAIFRQLPLLPETAGLYGTDDADLC